MITGSLQKKKGLYYVVLNLYDDYGKRKPKWIPTGYTIYRLFVQLFLFAFLAILTYNHKTKYFYISAPHGNIRRSPGHRVCSGHQPGCFVQTIQRMDINYICIQPFFISKFFLNILQ